MKFSKLLFGTYCCLILLLGRLSGEEDPDELESSKDEVEKDLDEIKSRFAQYASFLENRHHYLRIQHILHSDFVFDSMQCALNCLITAVCRSFNFRLQAEFDGVHLCELLASD